MGFVTANTSWECRSTGTATGGAGFDPSYGGTDYSQQDNPVLSGTDGVISGTNLQSTTGGFTAQMVGNCVYLSNSQTWRQITAFVDAHNVTLLDAPAATSGNTYHVGGAFLISQNGFQFPYQAGNTIWWRGSVTPTVNQPSISSSDGTKYVCLRGYGTTRGDSGYGTCVGGTIAADTIGLGSNAIIQNMILDGQNSQQRNGVGIGGNFSRVENCIIRNNTGTGGGINIVGSNYCEVKNCYIDIHQCTGAGINVGTVASPSSYTTIEHNTIRMNNSNHGIVWNAGSFGVAQFNVIFGANCGIAFFNGGSNWNNGAIMNFNSIANCSHKGIIVLNINTGMENVDIKGNIITGCVDAAIWWDGVDLTSIAPGTTKYLKSNIDTNAFYNNGANYHNLPGGNNDITLTADPFVDDVTTFDFHLNGAAGGGALCKGAWVVTNPDGVTTGTYTLGALGQAATVAPTPPTTLTANVTNSLTVSLNWVNTATSATSINIERSTNGGGYSVVATVGGGVTNYVDTTVSVANQYTYRVNALNSAGASGYSNTATVVIPVGIASAAAPVIDEVQFPTDISEGAQGGPSFSTIVTTASTGYESRVPMWQVGRYQFTIGYGQRDPLTFFTILNFFIARNGKARAFRFKDWNDFQATNEPLVPTGSKFVQLIKTYSSGPVSYVRNIFKPQTNLNPVTLTRNGTSYATWTLDTTTGLLTLTPDLSYAITGITQAASAVVTVTGHTFTVGQTVYFENVAGMTQINGLTAVISATTANTITVNLNTSTFSAYQSGGVAEKFVQPSETLLWTGEFDIPVRFDVDKMDMTMVASQIRDWQSVPVIEVLN